jgi:hypothetical protein
LAWFNDGQRELVIKKPEAGAALETLQLVAGTEQALPAAGIMLMDMTKNLGASGTDTGETPTYIEKRDMDLYTPDWHTHRARATVQHWTVDQRVPKKFWVYPPQPAAAPGQVQILYSKLPADVGAVGSAINIADEYQEALLDYVLYKAYLKGSKTEHERASTAAYQRFLTALGLKEQAEEMNRPESHKLKQQVVA